MVKFKCMNRIKIISKIIKNSPKKYNIPLNFCNYFHLESTRATVEPQGEIHQLVNQPILMTIRHAPKAFNARRYDDGRQGAKGLCLV